MALVRMWRGGSDEMAATAFYWFCGNIFMQFNDDWTRSPSSLPLSFLLIDPLALLNAKHREGGISVCNECENINHEFLPHLSFSLFHLLRLLIV